MSDWLTYSPISGHGNGIITITADTISSLEDRVATIIVSNSQYSLSASTSVTQKGAQLTAITFENLTWVTDVPASGGTATKDNCSYTVIGQYTNGRTVDVTEYVTVSGSLNVPVSTEMTRQNVGNLTLTANYDGFSASASISAYQAAPSITGIGFTSLVWAMDVPASGGTATKDNCKYTIYAYYETSVSKDISDVAVITGSLAVPATTAETRENVGNLTLYASYSGFTISETVDVYQRPFITLSTYLTFRVISDGAIIWASSDSYVAKTISYSKDKGATWTDITATTYGIEIPVKAGDNVIFKGDNISYASPPSYYNTFGTNYGAEIEIYGNLMSIINSSNFADIKTLNGNLFKLFYGCSGLIYAEYLLMPATTLTKHSYFRMFQGCTNLTTAPELPATELAQDCYASMFRGCTSLTTAPTILPATTLSQGCYQNMFDGCTSLTTAPELPAKTLSISCYAYMFAGCTLLNYIKCLALSVEDNNTNGWVSDVAPKGTFVKDINMTGWSTGNGGIPSGWVVEDYGILLTGITISDLVWETNVPASGGTATKDNCSYRIIANYSGGTTSEVTSESIVNGSQIVESSQITSAHTAGTLTLTATYSGYSAEASVTIMQDGYNPPTPPSPTGSSEYLTFTILSAGTINWRASDTSIAKTIEYKLNNGEWTSITSNTGSSAPIITVNSGDKLQFRGNNTEYNTGAAYYNSFSGSTAYFNLSGNILSLFYGDNFDAQTAPTIFRLGDMFQSTNVIDAGGLLLPNIVRRYCYFEMFCFCTKLTTAPVLPATTLEFKCYCAMFYGCTSLNYIKCLATDISEKDCTEDWVNGVAPTGTFVKASSMNNWATGSNGIPSGWTVTNAS